ncbi:hypothetical protein [Chromobacterium vaccinii]|uniref:hypothetical protein n=1 Tax=Chromobacterium vaccinii TaxID=1108595 RepID=UPI000E1B0DB4|nr:hypothetical protein [Chromobacterium vaccinii]SUX55936.1 Uncharacterised protein [Chromobacterium vaccinii]
MREEGFPLRVPADALSAMDVADLGLEGGLSAEAEDDEEDARWSFLPFMQASIERMCMLLLLAEDHEVDFSPLGEEGLAAIAAMSRADGDAVFAQISADYLAGLETLASMTGRARAGLHLSISGLYQAESA